MQRHCFMKFLLGLLSRISECHQTDSICMLVGIFVSSSDLAAVVRNDLDKKGNWAAKFCLAESHTSTAPRTRPVVEACPLKIV